MYGLRIMTCVAVVSFVAGCGSSQLPTQQVEAVVLLDDKPYGPANLSLSPVQGPDAKLPNAMSPIDAQGKAKPYSYQPGSGIVAGEYYASLSPDATTFGAPIVTRPLVVNVTPTTTTVELKFQTMKGKKPGYLPDVSTTTAPTELPPLR